MAESPFSPSWYRVAALKPRLRGHARLYRHRYRGDVWYVMQDLAKNQYYRFTPETYQVVGRMNGGRTVQDLWEGATERLGDDAPTQDEVIQLLGQLHSADVLICDVPPDTAELLRRSEKIQRAKLMQQIRSPLAIRLPLFDPDRFLTWGARFVRPAFTWYGGLVWLGLLITAISLAALHWSELTENIVDRVLSAQSLISIALVYPVVKAIHEMGHGFATKVWGGEVHEIGIMFLVFMPVPYVDASAASEFRARHRRAIVSSAGIMVELALASVAMIAWADMQPGVLRSIAYNVIIIGSVSTVLFNGNPLLRYDGYYILSDLLEIPNLAKRGTDYLGYLVKRYAFGVDKLEPNYAAHGERVWFVVYTLAAFTYRLFIYSAIVLFLAGKFFFIGILLAIWAAGSMVLIPLGKGLKFVGGDPVLREHRSRAIAVTTATIVVVLALLFLVPMPYRTRTEGVVWPPEESLVRAGSKGFIAQVVAEPGTRVERGDVLVECRDPLLDANVEVLRAKVAELTSRYDAAVPTDRVQANIVQQELDDSKEGLDRALERQRELEVRSPADGIFVVPNADDLPGRYVAQGDLVGFVLDIDRPTVRVVVPQSRIDLVRQHTSRVRVRPSENLDTIVDATIEREVPEAEEHLPSAILGSVGGGEIAIDPTEKSGTKTFERMFQFDLLLSKPLDRVFIGGRVFVRFDHGMSPLGIQWYRNVRQILLRRFNI